MSYIVIFLLLFYVTYVTDFVSYNLDNNSNGIHFIDLSQLCIDNAYQNIFIPLGVGAADGVSLLLSQPSFETFPQCNIYFYIAREHKSHLQIIVIEYIDSHHPFKEMIDSCNIMGNLTLKELEDNGTIINVCNQFQPSKYDVPVFVHIGFAGSIVLEINATDVFHSMKITFTAGRALGRHEYCNSTYEIQCTIGRETICINKALECDKNINCGVFDENDEDYKICRVSRFAYLWIVVLAGVVTFVLVFVIFVYLLRTYIAEISDNFFIFNEDEDNKLVIKSQLHCHVWQNIKKYARAAPDTSASATSD